MTKIKAFTDQEKKVITLQEVQQLIDHANRFNDCRVKLDLKPFKTLKKIKDTSHEIRLNIAKELSPRIDTSKLSSMEYTPLEKLEFLPNKAGFILDEIEATAGKILNINKEIFNHFRLKINFNPDKGLFEAENIEADCVEYASTFLESPQEIAVYQYCEKVAKALETIQKNEKAPEFLKNVFDTFSFLGLNPLHGEVTINTRLISQLKYLYR